MIPIKKMQTAFNEAVSMEAEAIHMLGNAIITHDIERMDKANSTLEIIRKAQTNLQLGHKSGLYEGE